MSWFRKKYFYTITFWLSTLAISTCVQKVYLDPLELHFFPNPEDLKPGIWKEFISYFQKDIDLPEPLLPQEEVLITGSNYEGLQFFYQKLKLLEEKRENVVRILHFGDSIIWADIFTLKMKELFQRDFGDGGRGAVPLFYKLERTLLEHKNPTPESYFLREKARPWGSVNPDLGFLGDTFIPAFSGATSSHIGLENSKPWQRLQIISRLPKNFTQAEAEVFFQVTTGSQIYKENLKLYKDRCSSFFLDLNSTKELQFSIFSPLVYPRIDAFILETNYGVSYSPVSIMGLEINDLLSIPEENFACGIQEFQPDLVIFQFGINESQNLWQAVGRNPKFYEKAFREVIQRFKKFLPHSSILLITPTERIRKNNQGYYITMPEMLKIREIIIQTAQEEKVAYFDSLKALGGEGKSNELYRAGIIQEDRTHLTRFGGDYLAEILYSKIYREYNQFLGKQIQQEEKKKITKETKNDKAVYFTSKSYIVFLLFVWIVSLILQNFPQVKILFLLFFSYYFYISWNFYPVFLLIFSTIVDYFCAKWIFQAQQLGRSGRKFLLISLLTNLSLLFFFKYFNFTLEILNQISNQNLPKYQILLPVGISFYTFQTLSYTIDVYRNTIQPENNYFKFALYVTFFPQLVAGPIVRANEFLPYMNFFGRHFCVSSQKFSKAIFLICNGIFLKLLADYLAVNLVDRVYSTPEMYTSTETLFAVYAYAIQIYGDFSGYTNIALGSAMLLGFHLTENFSRPYKALSLTDFWRRWHISLSHWFRDYLYIPLGGNRKRVYFNLWVTMFLCGLWHGAGWNFIFWGIYHGVILTIERIFLKKKIDQLPFKFREFISLVISKFGKNLFLTLLFRIFKLVLYRILNWLVTFHLIVFGWILFRSNNLEQFYKIIDNIQKQDWNYPNLDYKIIYIIIIFFIIHLTPVTYKESILKKWIGLSGSLQGIILTIFTIICFKISTSEVKAFIYFQF